jgi:D-inositol-3-phosphate glycosyltransferase
LRKRIGVVMYQTSRSKGQELVAQRMVSYFRKLGHEAYLITSIFHDEREVVSDDLIGDRGYVEVDDAELGIPIIRVASFTTRWPPRRIVFKDEVPTLERIANEFQLDVLITHSTLWNGPEAVAKFVEWRRNIKALGGYQDPLIFCHMSHYQEPSPRRYSLVERSFRMAWNRVSLRTILRIANLILVVTPYEEESKRKMGASKQKCVLFPGGVDDNSFLSFSTANPEELRQQLKLGPDVKIVAYIGTIEERKNPRSVLEVAEKLKERQDIHFVVAGRGDSEYADEIRKKAEALTNVTYLGEISERQKVLLIRAAYLNILLSKMEALGLAQLEFMFEGVPVITSGVGGQAWIIEDNKEGIHTRGAGDIEGAVRGIEELVKNPSKWERLSANSKEKAREFALTKLIKELDSALTREMEKESGLAHLPPEVRSTITEPEVVVRSWSHGTRKVAATSKRLFIQQGRLSRRTLEIPYANISSIEHIRRYDWQLLLLGTILSILLFTQHYLFPIVSIPLSSWIVTIAVGLLPNINSELVEILLIIWLVPIFIALPLFLVRARKGYALRTAAPNPTYLPRSFSEAIGHIREMQDKGQTNVAGDRSSHGDRSDSEKLQSPPYVGDESEN